MLALPLSVMTGFTVSALGVTVTLRARVVPALHAASLTL
jgi:hypothetical protein